MPDCKLIRPQESDSYIGKQGLSYFAGISAESAASKALCLHLLTIPPGGRARAHLHENHESAVYVISGEAEMWWGEGLREHMVIKAGAEGKIDTLLLFERGLLRDTATKIR